MWDSICSGKKLKIFDSFIVLYIFLRQFKVFDRICGARKFDHILNKCGSFCVGFASQTKGSLSPVPWRDKKQTIRRNDCLPSIGLTRGDYQFTTYRGFRNCRYRQHSRSTCNQLYAQFDDRSAFRLTYFRIISFNVGWEGLLKISLEQQSALSDLNFHIGSATHSPRVWFDQRVYLHEAFLHGL